MHNIIIPFIAAYLYWLGGQKNNWFRWGMGLPIGILAWITGHTFLTPLLSSCTYWIATSAFPYGEKSWLNFLGEKGKFATCGLVFGLASIPILGLYGIIQGFVGASVFLCIKILDDRGTIHNPAVELCRGFFGTVLFIFR